jgi:hypothetical protein
MELRSKLTINDKQVYGDLYYFAVAFATSPEGESLLDNLSELMEISRPKELNNLLTDWGKFDLLTDQIEKNNYDPEKYYHNYFYVNLGTESFLLDNGKILVKKYGKYRPNITFLLPDVKDQVSVYPKNIESEIKKMNIETKASIENIFTGNFFTSKKGNKIFDVKEFGRGSHLFIKVGWGGAFATKSNRGETNIPKKDMVYYLEARSNGGGLGDNYIIVPNGYKVQLSEDDI